MPTIDLSGPGGNAFALIAQVRTWGRQLGVDVSGVQANMMAGDYDNLIQVLKDWAEANHIDLHLIGE